MFFLIIKIDNLRGDLTDITAFKTPLVDTLAYTLSRRLKVHIVIADLIRKQGKN